MSSFKFKKAVQSLNYFATKEGGKINYMKAVKLIWLSDRLHMRIYGRTITSDNYIAMKNGPVPSATKDIVVKSGFAQNDFIAYSNAYLSNPEGYVYKSLKDVDLMVFSKTDITIMDKIYEEYKDYSQFRLSQYSHKFPEWRRFEKDLQCSSRQAFSVDEDDFFEPSDEKLFVQDPELLELSKEFFKHIA